MAALVCDICGGKLAISSGGIAVCDSCGMEHTKERMQEKVQEIKGTVRVDNSHMIDNFFTMAENAYEADNKLEAENYCNKIIEIDPLGHKAWLLKGKAAGWQSTIANSRFAEASVCFSKAFELAPDDDKKHIEIEIIEEMKNLSLALISLRGNRFANYPDESEAGGFLQDIATIYSAVIKLAEKTGIVVVGFVEKIAEKINASVVAAWSGKIQPDYLGTENRPNEYEWREFINRIGYCTMLVEKAIDLSDEDDEEDVQRYENLIFLHKEAIESCSWDYNFTDWGKSWHREYSLTNEAKSIRRKMISEYENKISQIKNKAAAIEKKEQEEKTRIEKEAAKKRFDEYWDAHSDEKHSLESEQKTIVQQINQLTDEINKIPGGDKKKQIQENIDKIIKEKSSLGLFKSKEKKTLQEQIDALSVELKLIDSEICNAKANIKSQIKPLKTRLSQIENELVKAR